MKMPSIDWNKLNSPSAIDVSWSILAPEISDKFFSGTLIAVPNINDADYFDLMVCFSKISYFWQRTTFRLLGHFLDISAPARKDHNMNQLWDILRNPLKEDLNSTSYSHTWTDEKKKSISIRMTGLSKYEVNWNIPHGSLALDCEKVDLCNKSVYVISEVVYAEKVIIDVQVNKKNIIEKRNKIPVAFSYLKFPVDDNGVLLAAKDTKLKFDAVFEK